MPLSGPTHRGTGPCAGDKRHQDNGDVSLRGSGVLVFVNLASRLVSIKNFEHTKAQAATSFGLQGQIELNLGIVSFGVKPYGMRGRRSDPQWSANENSPETVLPVTATSY